MLGSRFKEIKNRFCHRLGGKVAKCEHKFVSGYIGVPDFGLPEIFNENLPPSPIKYKERLIKRCKKCGHTEDILQEYK